MIKNRVYSAFSYLDSSDSSDEKDAIRVKVHFQLSVLWHSG